MQIQINLGNLETRNYEVAVPKRPTIISTIKGAGKSISAISEDIMVSPLPNALLNPNADAENIVGMNYTLDTNVKLNAPAAPNFSSAMKIGMRLR